MRPFLTTLLLLVAASLSAQESHYHRSLRSQDTDYTLTQEPHFNGSGMYWSCIRDANDVAITHPETREDSIARVRSFSKLCGQAYDAYEQKDYYHTILFGDSALSKGYHTPDLYYYMGVSFEQLGAYNDANLAYKLAMKSGYTKVPDAYSAFQARQKQRKLKEKQQRREERKNGKK